MFSKTRDRINAMIDLLPSTEKTNRDASSSTVNTNCGNTTNARQYLQQPPPPPPITIEDVFEEIRSSIVQLLEDIRELFLGAEHCLAMITAFLEHELYSGIYVQIQRQLELEASDQYRSMIVQIESNDVFERFGLVDGCSHSSKHRNFWTLTHDLQQELQDVNQDELFSEAIEKLKMIASEQSCSGVTKILNVLAMERAIVTYLQSQDVKAEPDDLVSARYFVVASAAVPHLPVHLQIAMATSPLYVDCGAETRVFTFQEIPGQLQSDLKKRAAQCAAKST
eukprot:c7181_g1_i2.p1 GENE.c7181_g1_i2~~c7181_g1_i2.p1  ORF type:complete len:328 (+),score=89.18 c7181_g1_i2:143-985(+)